MNETSQTNQRPRELFVFYTPIYNIIIQRPFLNHLESGLLTLIASYQGLGCNWARASLKERFECGPYHLDRAIKRLQFMHMIRVIPGLPKGDGSRRREKNRYIFEPDPYCWRVTKEVQDLIVQETIRMEKEPKQFKYNAFPNDLGLDIAFAKTFPRFAKGKKGRRKKSSEFHSDATTVDENISVTEEALPSVESEDSKWQKRYQSIVQDDVRFTYLAGEYFGHLKAIRRVTDDPLHNFSIHKITFLERLNHIYTEKCKALNPEELKIYQEIQSWLNDGKTTTDIYLKLSALDTEARMKQEG